VDGHQELIQANQVTGDRTSRRWRVLMALAAAFLILVAGTVWFNLRARGQEAVAPPPAPEQAEHRVETPRTPRPAPPPSQPTKKLELEYATDGLPYMPPGPEYPQPNTFAHPHPITDQHKRIFRENAYLYQLNEAMDGKEVPRLRRLLEQYRDDFPDDPHDMQRGYQLIADCQEFANDPAIRQRAETYFATEISSTLRRFVRRHCLQ
jgi:hypothetical protein